MAQTKSLKPSIASSQREKLVRKSAADMKVWRTSLEGSEQMRKTRESGLNPSAASLKAIPELTDNELAGAYRLKKKRPISVRVDDDVLAWLKAKPGKYQRHLNAVLRAAMMRETKTV